MQYRLSDMIAWLRDISERYTGSEEEDLLLFIKEGAEKFPKAKREDIAEAFAAYQLEVQQEREEDERQAAELEAMIAFNNKHSIPPDMPWNEAVRMVAERGDPEAQGILRDLESPEATVADELLNAAVDAHPAWSRDGRYFTFDPEIGGPEDGPSLIDWYQRTHPHEAAAITDRIVSST
ncbi:hypothetical protein [Methylobacterium isbiliense]|uniref:Uncharacterized protein n=1 Tax=Methylobacterium isbiliense TaxID=315478 RepID=A0ABQ4SA93_9HYPH|nr:hypothetical protein [Methylobacterium isbiliense]MDN3625596.1 hypothetical protein [Methylobacterium isbiliense]GJE00032.1 hypothetical protein GMJLKIPL_1950 [Methylobacterium isbiliense]